MIGMTARDIGIDVKAPERECEDVKCPFHGTLPVRGRMHTGNVVSQSQATVRVRWDYYRFLPKYERYMRQHSKVSAHVPPCMDIKKGDFVRIAECRPISKTKSFVVIEKMEAKE